MTFNEFKYWLQGFEYLFANNKYPDEVQWTEIKSKLNEVYDYSPISSLPKAEGPADWTFGALQTDGPVGMNVESPIGAGYAFTLGTGHAIPDALATRTVSNTVGEW